MKLDQHWSNIQFRHRHLTTECHYRPIKIKYSKQPRNDVCHLNFDLSLQLCRSELFIGNRELKGDDLVIYRMYTPYAGLYTCVVSYQMNGRTLQFTRAINITAVGKTFSSPLDSFHLVSRFTYAVILNPASSFNFIYMV